jgi:Spy/CpxP family protein refolding chaperone
MKDGVESLGRIRTKGITLLAVTFLAGALAGGAAERIRMAKRPPPPVEPPDFGMMAGGRPGMLPRWFQQLDLTEEQRDQIRQIIESRREPTEQVMREMMPRLRAASDSVMAEIRAVLTPEQLEKWDELQAEMRRRGGQMRQGMGRGKGPGGPPPPMP